MIAVRNLTNFDDSQAVERLSSPEDALSDEPDYALSDELRNARPGDVIPDCASITWSDVQDGQGVFLWEITGLSFRK